MMTTKIPHNKETVAMTTTVPSWATTAACMNELHVAATVSMTTLTKMSIVTTTSPYYHDKSSFNKNNNIVRKLQHTHPSRSIWH